MYEMVSFKRTFTTLLTSVSVYCVIICALANLAEAFVCVGTPPFALINKDNNSNGRRTRKDDWQVDSQVLVLYCYSSIAIGLGYC
jgi:hypothetical protein